MRITAGKKQAMLSAGVALMLGGAATASALATGSSGADEASAGSTAATGDSSASITFSRAYAAGKAVPEPVKTRLVSLVQRDIRQLELDKAKLLEVTPIRALVLVPKANNSVCLISVFNRQEAGATSTCQPNEVAASEGLAFAGPVGGVVVAPDSVTTVRFEQSAISKNGAVVDLPVGPSGVVHAPDNAVQAQLVKADGSASGTPIEFLTKDDFRGANISPEGIISSGSDPLSGK